MLINFRSIPFYFIKKSFNVPYKNLAFDNFLFNEVLLNNYPAIFRIYEWNNSTISIGYFQKDSSINVSLAKKLNIPIIRRITGGKAIFHDKYEITLSIILNYRQFKQDSFTILKKRNLFLSISENFIEIFKKLNFPVSIQKNVIGNLENPNCFKTKSIAEIVNKYGEKIFGSSIMIKHPVIINQICIPFSKKNLSQINPFIKNTPFKKENTHFTRFLPYSKKKLFIALLKEYLSNSTFNTTLKKNYDLFNNYSKKYKDIDWKL